MPKTRKKVSVSNNTSNPEYSAPRGGTSNPPRFQTDPTGARFVPNLSFKGANTQTAGEGVIATTPDAPTFAGGSGELDDQRIDEGTGGAGGGGENSGGNQSGGFEVDTSLNN